MIIARRANPGMFAVIGWDVGGEERPFFAFNMNTLEDAMGIREQLVEADRERGLRSEYGVYDDQGNRLDKPAAPEEVRN